MNYYYDTSALCRHYHEEQGSDRIAQLIAEANARHFISWLTIVETHSALAQVVRTGQITARKLQSLSKRLKTDIVRRRFLVVRMTRSFFDDAAELVLKHGGKQRLRAADAIHLAIASQLANEKKIDRFVTADTNQAAIARQLALSVFNPLDG